jgi:hypothetical protein
LNTFRLGVLLIVLGFISACATAPKPQVAAVEDPLLKGHMVERDLSNSLVIINPEVTKK